MIGPRLACLALLLSASHAIAAAPAPAPPDPAPAPSNQESPAPIIPAAKDSLSGHFLVGASGLVLLPMAMLDSKTSFLDRAGTGVGVTGDIGIGISRYVSLGAFADYAYFTSPTDCPSCESDSLAIGGFARYHLVQGTRYDPWITLGLGYRRLTSTGEPGKVEYAGIDWLRATFGGDWYALSQLGFGPYAQLTLGTFSDRPSRTSATVYGMVNFGLRVSFDLPGR